MLYFSEVTNKAYKTANECVKAEEEALNLQAKKKAEEEKKKAARKVAADKVEAARKAYVDAQHKYSEALQSFCESYGPYHKTITDKEIPTFFNFDPFFFL